MLKCLAFEDWFLDVIASRKDRSTAWKATVGMMLNKYSVGTLKRLTECYRPSGAVFWWGRAMPPADVWRDEESVATAKFYADETTMRYNTYAGRKVPGRYEMSQHDRPDMFKWVPDEYAYAGFRWCDASDAAELYGLCLHMVSMDPLGDTIEDNYEGYLKWDPLDLFDVDEMWMPALVPLLKDGDATRNCHVPAPRDIVARLSDCSSSADQVTAANDLLEFYAGIQENQSDVDKGKRAVMHMFREMSPHITRYRPCHREEKEIVVFNYKDHELVAEFADIKVWEAENYFGQIGQDNWEPSDNKLFPPGPHISQPRRTLAREIIETDKDVEARYDVPFCTDFPVDSRKDLIACLDAIRKKPLEEYLRQLERPVNGIHPDKDKYRRSHGHIGMLAKISNCVPKAETDYVLASSGWGLVTDCQLIDGVQQHAVLYDSWIWDKRYFTDFSKSPLRETLDDSLVPTNFGTFLYLGTTLSHVENGRFVSVLEVQGQT